MKSLKNLMMLCLVVFLTSWSVDATAQVYVSGPQAVSILTDQLDISTSNTLSATTASASQSKFVAGLPATHIVALDDMYNFVASRLLLKLRSNVAQSIPAAMQNIEDGMIARNLIDSANQNIFDIAKADVLQSLQ